MLATPDIARVAALVADPTRAVFLLALMSGQALTATELAASARITKQTASAHLSKLLDARLLAVESQGRHRYFRLADADVGQLLEHLLGVAARSGASALPTGPSDAGLRKARVCYDHLAGDLGVMLFESVLQQGLLDGADDGLPMTAKGRRFFHALGVDVASLQQQRRPLCRRCLDWSVRRPHLAGALGAALLDHVLGEGWARRSRQTRAVNFTVDGERVFRQHFRLAAR